MNIIPEDFYKTQEGVNQYIKMAEGVDSSQLKDSSLLELGSGPGTDWRLLNEHFNVTGSDNSAEFIKHLKNENQKGEFVQLDATTFDIEKRFDGIYSNKVMHHLTDHEFKKSIKS